MLLRLLNQELRATIFLWCWIHAELEIQLELMVLCWVSVFLF